MLFILIFFSYIKKTQGLPAFHFQVEINSPDLYYCLVALILRLMDVWTNKNVSDLENSLDGNGGVSKVRVSACQYTHVMREKYFFVLDFERNEVLTIYGQRVTKFEIYLYFVSSFSLCLTHL